MQASKKQFSGVLWFSFEKYSIVVFVTSVVVSFPYSLYEITAETQEDWLESL